MGLLFFGQAFSGKAKRASSEKGQPYLHAGDPLGGKPQRREKAAEDRLQRRPWLIKAKAGLGNGATPPAKAGLPYGTQSKGSIIQTTRPMIVISLDASSP